jgi:hypothetical protein
MPKMRTKIVGKAKKGYRRGGVSHDRVWKEFQLSKDQIHVITDDPRLKIEKVETSKAEPVEKELDRPPPRRRKKTQQGIPE